MQVVFHTGAHYTDDGRLLKCLLNNKDEFRKRNVAVPGPGKYRTLLKDAFAALDGTVPAADARNVLVDAILDDETADRLILTNEHFFGSPRFALGNGQLYPLAAERMRHLDQLFDSDRIELCMAVCNPATFLPKALDRASAEQQAQLLAATPPQSLLWSELFTRIRHALPEMPITIWCNEDTPVIWPEVIRALAGLEPGEKINGGFDLLREIMSREGMRRFRAYLRDHPNLTDTQKKRVMIAFLDKYALAEKLEEELDLPGWTGDLVEELTEIYDNDIARLTEIPGLRLITP
ncbi:hypothetical protein CVM52_13505 [Pseudooceanicola lipolyticus]|uniref:Uncharacterized protein n=1 Tax=Pseudooceanicola lipolyticus TaxID=2029104 RepID=A0A2M8J073_9RHOB|nr:hypothetical protein [Pseudooceanicola lipolyticus]PJE36154.1 hypothetical protein CVM52_13505 [Pseudooceanicola lipolyticus]